jgi:ABC-type branched-subunit amino acid transport system ATPase component
VLIDEPSIGLSPLMVQQTFNILKELRSRGVSILMIEQNARSALEISDFGIVLELGQTRLVAYSSTACSGAADCLRSAALVEPIMIASGIERTA